MSNKPVPGYSQDFAEMMGFIQQTRQRIIAQANTASKASAIKTGGV